MFEKWTDRARGILVKATQKALDFQHAEVTPIHLIWAVFEPSQTGMARTIITQLTADANFQYLEAEVTAITPLSTDCEMPAKPSLSRDAVEAVKAANDYAARQVGVIHGSQGYVGTQDIAYILLTHPVIQKAAGVTAEQWEATMYALLGKIQTPVAVS